MRFGLHGGVAIVGHAADADEQLHYQRNDFAAFGAAALLYGGMAGLGSGQVWEAVGCAVPILVSAFVILYLYKKSKSLISMGMPMSVLKEDKIFDKVIAMKYDIPNDKPELFEQYKKDIDAFYEDVIERNA